MPAEKATAIVLRVVDFSETSAVVTLFTREFGKIGALAKGARRPKGPFESALDLLAVCRIVFLHKSSDVLDLLTEAKLLRRFRPAGRDLASLYAGYYVAELLTELTDQDDPHPDLFDAAERTLEELAGGLSVAEVVLRFELAALRLLGHSPALGQCVECGANVAGARRVAFGLLAGGVLCERCRPRHKKVVSVSPKVVAALKAATEGGSFDVQGYHGELRAVLNQYLYHLIGHRLRLHDFLGTVCQ